MTTRVIKVKGEALSFLAYADSAEQLVTGDTTGDTGTAGVFKVKGTYLHWFDYSGDERRKEGTLTGESRAAGSIKVKGETALYGDYSGDERSVSAIEHGIEEQTLSNGAQDFLGPPHADLRLRQGQKLTIAGRTVSKLAFTLIRLGTVSGDISFTIRKVSNGDVIVTKVLGDASAIATSATQYEVTFDTPVAINEEVRIVAEWPTATYSSGNSISFRRQASNVKAGEGYCHYHNGAWVDTLVDLWDATYKYTY